MLRITPSAGTQRAKSYFIESLQRSDYYSEGQELAGTWGGRGAVLLGLQGNAGQEEFFRLCENRHPQTGDPLTLRTNTNRRTGYDINFHCPKSVSLQFGLQQDPQIRSGFEDAVERTMQLIELDVETRASGGVGQTRTALPVTSCGRAFCIKRRGPWEGSPTATCTCTASRTTLRSMSRRGPGRRCSLAT